jgi:prevent-host-death family protein
VGQLGGVERVHVVKQCLPSLVSAATRLAMVYLTTYDRSYESSSQKAGPMSTTQTISASEFKAKCLDILDRLADRRLERVIITKRGRAVAMLVPPEDVAEAVREMHGFVRGSVEMPPDFDLTARVADEPFAADHGEVHG